MADPSALSPQARIESLDAMTTEELDVLVVGGGVVGAGVALDAVTRGLSTGLVEQRDLASGTSSRSSKLIHGGLRYLEMLDFGLVREALQERGLLLTRLAPHLVRPVPFLYPLTHKFWERPYVGAGLALYDGMAMAGKYDMGVPKHRHLTRKSVARIAPDFAPESIAGAIRYYDCQVDDARLVMTVARTAASHGAKVATRVKVTGFLREGERVVGVRARDLEHGIDLEIRARVVVNAAGVWTDDIQEMVGGRGSLHVQASKGIHLVVPRDRIRSEAGFIVRTEKSVLFVIPWGRHWIIGTTDTPWDLDKAHPAASRADIDYILGHVNAILREPLDHEDVEGVYAGLRPLLSGESEPTSKISREHTVVTPVPGLVMIAGGKLTTYRVMAVDAVDAAGHSLKADGYDDPGLDHRPGPAGRCRGFEARSNQRVALARRAGLHVARIDHLLGRYGSRIDDLLALIDARPDLATPLEAADDHLEAEIVYAVTHEGARHLDDVLTRRTRISIETFDRGVRAALARRRADGRGARLGRRPPGRRGRPLPAPRRGRASVAARADRPGGRRGPGEGARHRLSGGHLRDSSAFASFETPVRPQTNRGSVRRRVGQLHQLDHRRLRNLVGQEPAEREVAARVVHRRQRVGVRRRAMADHDRHRPVGVGHRGADVDRRTAVAGGVVGHVLVPDAEAPEARDRRRVRDDQRLVVGQVVAAERVARVAGRPAEVAVGDLVRRAHRVGGVGDLVALGLLLLGAHADGQRDDHEHRLEPGREARSSAAVSSSPCRIGSGSSSASMCQVTGRPVTGVESGSRG